MINRGTYNAVKTVLSANGKLARGRMIIYTDLARKRNRKEVLTNYNKTRINIGRQHDRWMEWGFKFMQSCWSGKHQCHCACSSEIGTCIINDAGWQAAQKKPQRNYTFETDVLRVNINFQGRINTFKNITKLNDIIPLTTSWKWIYNYDTLCDTVCQWLATDRRFSPVTSTNKTDRATI